MRSNSAFLGLAALLCLAGVADAVAPPPPKGFLTGREPDTLAGTPQAPAPGSPRDDADRAIFLRTRALEGSPRWNLAKNDNELTMHDLMGDFSCAVGVELTPEHAPHLVTLIRRAAPDIDAAYGAPKDVYKRPRPYLRDNGDICVARNDLLDKSYDYPSGHATWAWTFGLILAQIAPDRSGPILQRARAFGESRAVCGVHSASAVEAARDAADTLMTALNSDHGFRDSLAGARADVRSLRADASTPKPAGCEAEAALTAATPW